MFKQKRKRKENVNIVSCGENTSGIYRVINYKQHTAICQTPYVLEIREQILTKLTKKTLGNEKIKVSSFPLTKHNCVFCKQQTTKAFSIFQ